jgi:hypothetical protein
MKTFFDFIYVGENIVSPFNCKNIIKYFENNPKLQEMGKQGDHKIDKSLKFSTDICFLPEHSSNKKHVRVLNPFLKALDEEIQNVYKKRFNLSLLQMEEWSLCQYFNLQRYHPGEGYFNWHFESSSKKSADRKIVWMFYLNDVENGGTEFYHQNLCTEAKEGSLIIWPADWTHLHRGHTEQKNTKYILTGWYTFNGEEF